MRNNICIIFFLLTTSVYSQQLISGFITDSLSGEKIIGANVFCTQTKQGTTTNGYGYFSMKIIENDSVQLRVSYVGYQNKELIVFCKKDTVINLTLTQGVRLNEISITASSLNNRSEPGVLHLSALKAKELPKLAGEADILRVFQLMPGVQKGVEGTSNIYVRGGNADQNMFLLDDVPLYYVSHLAGFISVFNPDAVNSIAMYKGGFSAKYGGRLSSVVEVKLKEGNLNERKRNFTFGLLSSKLTYEIPLKKDTSSMIISLRRSLFDLLTRGYFLLAESANQKGGYTLYDFNLKFNRILSPKDRLYLSFYTGHDRFFAGQTLKDESKEGKIITNRQTLWGNNLASFRWNHVYNNSLFCNTTLGFTNFKFDISSSYKHKVNSSVPDNMDVQFLSKINDILLKSDFEYALSAKQYLKFGGTMTQHFYNPSVNLYKTILNNQLQYDTSIYSPKLRAFETALYCEDEYKYNERVKITGGLRIASFFTQKKMYVLPEPRLLVDYEYSPKLNFKSSYSFMSQAVHLLASSGSGLPVDLWVPSTKSIKPEKAHQITFGAAYGFNDKSTWFLTADLFYKRMTGLIDYKDGISLYTSKGDWQSKVEKNGTGNVFGLELMLEKKTGKTTGWISYTFSRNFRKYPGLNNGRTFPYVYDHPHEISVVFIQKFNENISLSAVWVYSSGNNITLPNATNVVYSFDVGYNELENLNPDFTYAISDIYPSRNNYRLPSYHRLDLSLTFFKYGKIQSNSFSIDIYNAYCRLNTFYLYFKKDDVTGKMRMYSFTMFPIIPSISYSFKF